MITEILEPLVCERFRNDPYYRERHLRVINALPSRSVLGLHIPDIKKIARSISKNGCKVVKSNGKHHMCANNTEIIRDFETEETNSLCYEETIIWGYLINSEKTTLEKRFRMLEAYIPILDNWAVCDSFCSNIKWIRNSDKEAVWEFLNRWFNSNREFEVRFAIITAMSHYIDEEWLERVFHSIERLNFSKIESEYRTSSKKAANAQEGTVLGKEPYYVRMGVAWLLATALAKFPEQTREFVHTTRLPEDIIRLYIRKARESFRTREVMAI